MLASAKQTNVISVCVCVGGGALRFALSSVSIEQSLLECAFVVLDSSVRVTVCWVSRLLTRALVFR